MKAGARRPCRGFAGVVLVGALVAWLGLGPRAPWLAGADYSDYLIAHAPQVAFVRRAVAAWRTLPLWSPVYNAGYPLYANPLASPAYPPGWVAYLLPVPWGLNLALLLHLAWAVVGWGCWARGKGLRAWPWFGLVAGMLPRTLLYGLGGHVTLIYALAWVPWLLLSVGRGLLPGAVLGLLVLADPRAAPLALVLLVFVAARGREPHPPGPPPLIGEEGAGRAPGREAAMAPPAGDVRPLGAAAAGDEPHPTDPRAGSWLGQLFRWGLVSLAVAAPLLVPLAGFVLHSPREDMDFAARTALSLPWPVTFDLFAPLPTPVAVAAEYRLFVPWAVLLLAARAWFAGRGRRGAGLALVGLLLAVGRYGPLAWLWLLPGMGLLRVPARFAWVVAWGLLWAALEARPQPSLGRGYARLWLALGGLGLTLRAAVWPGLWGLPPRLGPYGLALLADVLAWWWLRPRARVSPARVWALAWVAALAWAGVYAAARPVETLEAADRRVAQALLAAADADAWAARWTGPRVYSPSYSIGQWTAAREGPPLAYGVDPLYTRAWARWLERASGVPWPGYTVTLPPLEGPDPTTANAAYRADAALLSEARVAWLVAGFPHPAAGWRLVDRIAGRWVYANAHGPCPLAWVEAPDRPGCPSYADIARAEAGGGEPYPPDPPPLIGEGGAGRGPGRGSAIAPPAWDARPLGAAAAGDEPHPPGPLLLIREGGAGRGPKRGSAIAPPPYEGGGVGEGDFGLPPAAAARAEGGGGEPHPLGLPPLIGEGGERRGPGYEAVIAPPPYEGGGVGEGDFGSPPAAAARAAGGGGEPHPPGPLLLIGEGGAGRGPKRGSVIAAPPPYEGGGVGEGDFVTAPRLTQDEYQSQPYHTRAGPETARVLLWQPNRVVVQAQGPGRLVLSEGDYFTWRVFVDGRPVAKDQSRAPWRAVTLPPGQHTVEWRLYPWELALGWLVALGGWVWVVRCWRAATRGDERRARS